MIDVNRLDFSAAPWVFEVLTHLWQSSLVGLVVLGVIAWCGGLSARTRRTLAWLAIAKFALPSVWLAQLFEHASGTPGPWLAAEALTVPLSASATALSASPVAKTFPVMPLLAAIWLFGAVGLLAWWSTRAMRAWRSMLATAAPLPDHLVQRVAWAAAAAGLSRAPTGAIVPADHGPGVSGIFAPRLLLPRGLDETLTPAELDAILLHECVHLRSRDNGWSVVRAVFVALLWFNPVAWWLNRVLSRETEKACDERVLEITRDPDAYASGIVAAVKHGLGIARPGFSGATTPPVLARIKAILDFPARRERPLLRGVALLAVAIAMLFSGRAGSIAAEATPTPARNKVGTITLVFTEPTTLREEQMRSLLEVRAGDEFNEVTLDRSVRALYRSGLLKTIEVKHTAAATPSTYDLVFTLTPKAEREAESATSPVAPRPPVSELDLAGAREKLRQRSEQLKKLRDERAEMLKQKRELDAMHSAASAARPSLTWNGQPVYDLSALDRAPVSSFQRRPQYPAELRQARVSGEVVVEFIVDDKGQVASARALRSSHAGFEASAVECVSAWRFLPGFKDGVPVYTRLQIPIVYTLNEE